MALKAQRKGLSIYDLHEEVTQNLPGFQTPRPKQNQALLQILILYLNDLTLGGFPQVMTSKDNDDFTDVTVLSANFKTS